MGHDDVYLELGRTIMREEVDKELDRIAFGPCINLQEFFMSFLRG